MSEIYNSSDSFEGDIFDSSNSDCFLQAVMKNEASVYVFIANDEDKSEIKFLNKYKIHMILLAINKDAKTKIEDKYFGKTNVTVATRENLLGEIDDLLERISLEPLKPICEHCYDMFHEKNSTIHGNEDEPNKLSKIKKKKQNIQSNGFHGDKHSMINPVQRKLGNSTVTSGSRTNNKTERITNGSTSKCTDVRNKDISFKTSTAIYTRTRSHLRIAGNTNGFNDCGLGADVDESTRSSLGKSKKRPIDTNGSVLKEGNNVKILCMIF
jgi:hypothetical protein